MRRFLLFAGALAFAAVANVALAQKSLADETTGNAQAQDSNQGDGNQTQADDDANVGDGVQTSSIGEEANIGDGNAADTEEANTGDGNQATSDGAVADDGSSQGNEGDNWNNGDRTSHDVVMALGNNAHVANVVLETTVSGNSVQMSDNGSGSPNSSLSISGSGNLSSMYGVNAIALNSGAAAVQNVSVNVTSSVGSPPRQGGPGPF